MAKADYRSPPEQTAPAKSAEAAAPVAEPKAEADLKGPPADVTPLLAGGWFKQGGRWFAPPSLSYRGDDGLMTAVAKNSHYGTEEALALEARRHRQP